MSLFISLATSETLRGLWRLLSGLQFTEKGKGAKEAQGSFGQQSPFNAN
jgi:hypothetical protein